MLPAINNGEVPQTVFLQLYDSTLQLRKNGAKSYVQFIHKVHMTSEAQLIRSLRLTERSGGFYEQSAICLSFTIVTSSLSFSFSDSTAEQKVTYEKNVYRSYILIIVICSLRNL